MRRHAESDRVRSTASTQPILGYQRAEAKTSSEPDLSGVAPDRDLGVQEDSRSSRASVASTEISSQDRQQNETVPPSYREATSPSLGEELTNDIIRILQATPQRTRKNLNEDQRDLHRQQPQQQNQLPPLQTSQQSSQQPHLQSEEYQIQYPDDQDMDVIDSSGYQQTAEQPASKSLPSYIPSLLSPRVSNYTVSSGHSTTTDTTHPNMPMLVVTSASPSTESPSDRSTALSTTRSQTPLHSPAAISSHVSALMARTPTTTLLHNLIVAHDLNAIHQHRVNETNARRHAVHLMVAYFNALKARQLQNRVESLESDLRRGVELVRSLFLKVAEHSGCINALESTIDQFDEEMRLQCDNIHRLEESLRQQREEYDAAFAKMDQQVREQTARIENQNAALASLLKMRFRADMVVDFLIFLAVYRISNLGLTRAVTSAFAEGLSQLIGSFVTPRHNLSDLTSTAADFDDDVDLDTLDLPASLPSRWNRLPRMISRSFARYRAHRGRVLLLESLIRWIFILIMVHYLRKRAVRAGFHGNVGTLSGYFVFFTNSMQSLKTFLVGDLVKESKPKDGANQEHESKRLEADDRSITAPQSSSSSNSLAKKSPSTLSKAALAVASTVLDAATSAGRLVARTVSGVTSWVTQYGASTTTILDEEESKIRRRNSTPLDTELDSDSDSELELRKGSNVTRPETRSSTPQPSAPPAYRSPGSLYSSNDSDTHAPPKT